MANRRMLDGAFWDDRTLQTKLSLTARYLFIALISHADDEGRVVADARWLKSRVFLYDDDVSVNSVETALEEIKTACRSVCFYEANGEQFIAFLKWEQYQLLKNSRPSSLPPPPAKAIPTTGKPGRKRKLHGAPDNIPIGSQPASVLSDVKETDRQRIGNESGAERPLKEVEEKRSRKEGNGKEGNLARSEREHARAREAEPPDRLITAIAEVCFDLTDASRVPSGEYPAVTTAVVECREHEITPDEIRRIPDDWPHKTAPHPKQIVAEVLRQRQARKPKRLPLTNVVQIPDPSTLPPKVTPETFANLRRPGARGRDSA